MAYYGVSMGSNGILSIHNEILKHVYIMHILKKECLVCNCGVGLSNRQIECKMNAFTKSGMFCVGSSACPKLFGSVRGYPEHEVHMPLLPYTEATIVDTGQVSVFKMSLGMRKPAFCICENKDADQLRGNKDADQLRGNRETDQGLCFRYTDSTIPLFLNPKFQASSHLLSLYRPVCVEPGRKPRRPVLSQRGSISSQLHL